MHASSRNKKHNSQLHILARTAARGISAARHARVISAVPQIGGTSHRRHMVRHIVMCRTSLRDWRRAFPRREWEN